jgi:predicted CXXCH cytochrome family protein
MRRFSSLLASMAALATAFVYLPLSAASGMSKSAQPFSKHIQIPGAKPVGAEMCATCHADVAKNFQHVFHQQQGVTCEDCHGNGSLHVEGGGDLSKIISLTRQSTANANGVCLNCHAGDENTRHWTTGAHAANGVRCIDCHLVHATAVIAAQGSRARFDTATQGARNADLVSPETNVIVQSRAASNEACVRCHRTEGAQLSMPYHHPLREGKMGCADCHDPHGGTAGHNLRASNVNQLCLSCHAQYRGPFTYQHPPVSENCMSCHTAHGSPNTNLLSVSVPALCLQCHSGHHNGAGLPVTDRCTNCHSSIHGTDVATPSGGSRFVDKGQWGLPSNATRPTVYSAHRASNVPAYGAATATAAAGAATVDSLRRIAREKGAAVDSDPSAVWSMTPASYRLLHISGFPGRVGEYDSLQQSVGMSSSISYVLPQKHLTVVSRGTVVSGNDYSLRSQLTISDRLKALLDIRSLVQQQDHYLSYIAQLSPDFAVPGSVTDAIPANSVFAVTRRLANGYVRVKTPKWPVHIFVKGNVQARTGLTQLIYLDENSTPAVYVGGANTTCGQQCHLASQFQGNNATTRNIAGGADAEVKSVLHILYEHRFSSFNDRLIFPTATYTGPFTPEDEGFSTVNPPPSGPAPQDVPAGNYYLDIPSPSQFSADSLSMNLTPSSKLIANGQITYTRLRNTFTRNPQNWFDTDETVSWMPLQRLRLTANHHQQNMINGFAPYYTLYGDVSYHRHWEGFQAEFELPAGFSIETHYRRSRITRSNAALWPQIYSFDNTDLQTIVPSSISKTAGLVLHYRIGLWNARAGYEWTGTDHPGFLIVPGSHDRMFASIWITPQRWLTFSNDVSIDAQNAFPSPALPNTPSAAQGFGGDVSGLPANFHRRDRFYVDAASLEIRPSAAWNLGLGYSYQQNDLSTYMAFQNDSSVNYVVDEPLVPFKQLSQIVWGDTTYTVKEHFGLNLHFTHNASNSGYRPNLNPNDAASVGNAALIDQGVFDPGMFQSALDNLALSSTQISAVRVHQWLGDGKALYLFPHKVEAGLVFHYGGYADYWHPNVNGVLRTFDVYVGRTW